MGLSKTHIGNPLRRDRLLFVAAIATIVLTLLGAAGETIGLDRYLKANTSKRRTLSLFKQGNIYFKRLATIVDSTLAKLLNAFYVLIDKIKSSDDELGVV
jgi:hypothetical protein